MTEKSKCSECGKEITISIDEHPSIYLVSEDFYIDGKFDSTDRCFCSLECAEKFRAKKKGLK